jgi:hypothetical protein
MNEQVKELTLEELKKMVKEELDASRIPEDRWMIINDCGTYWEPRRWSFVKVGGSCFTTENVAHVYEKRSGPASNKDAGFENEYVAIPAREAYRRLSSASRYCTTESDSRRVAANLRMISDELSNNK